MTDPRPDVLADLRAWKPRDEVIPTLEGAVDPTRSDGAHLFFASDPCRGPWIRIPVAAVAALRVRADVRCGPVAWPEVEIDLDPADPATPTVADAVRAALAGASGPAGAGGRDVGLAGGAEGGGETETHDVRVEIRPEGKLYRIRVQLEGEEVRRVEWDAARKAYFGEVAGLPVADTLDVAVQAWGNEGARLMVTASVDGRPLAPPLEVEVTERPGEGRRSYRI